MRSTAITAWPRRRRSAPQGRRRRQLPACSDEPKPPRNLTKSRFDDAKEFALSLGRDASKDSLLRTTSMLRTGLSMTLSLCQVGAPAEEDLVAWGHHWDVCTVPDAVMQRMDPGIVSFVFSCKARTLAAARNVEGCNCRECDCACRVQQLLDAGRVFAH